MHTESMRRNVRRNSRRYLRRATSAAAALALALLAAAPAGAQPRNYKYEIRLEGGGWFPASPISDALKSAGTVGATASWMFSPDWSTLLSGAWTSSQDKDPSGSLHVNIYQYDVGIEWSAKAAELNRWDLRPYVGAGLGGRSYSPERATEPSQSVFDGYLSAGLSLWLEEATWRVGLRNYISGWNGLMKTQSATADDVAIIAGFGFRF